jgi:hypothetical protein
VITTRPVSDTVPNTLTVVYTGDELYANRMAAVHRADVGDFRRMTRI